MHGSVCCHGSRLLVAWFPGVTGEDLLGQNLGDVLYRSAREVLDLLAARDSGHADDRLVRSRADAREEPLLTDFARHFVVLGLVAERASHPATASAGLARIQVRLLQYPHRRNHSDQRLLVAMTVEEHLALLCSPRDVELVASSKLRQVLVDHERLRGDGSRVIVVR